MTTITLEDEEFGPVAVRVNPRAHRVILRVKHDGSVHITVPNKRSFAVAERLLNEARAKVRSQRQEIHQQAPEYAPGSMVGRWHQLVFRAVPAGPITTRVTEDQIVVKYPMDMDPQDPRIATKIHEATKKALRREAAEYLPPRLARLAKQWGFTYKEARITSGHTRWGSCSSDNTISLNLSLMSLPEHLIDYVICHELCHTVEHNHSDQFWTLVASYMPNWKEVRKELKAVHPF